MVDFWPICVLCTTASLCACCYLKNSFFSGLQTVKCRKLVVKLFIGLFIMTSLKHIWWIGSPFCQTVCMKCQVKVDSIWLMCEEQLFLCSAKVDKCLIIFLNQLPAVTSQIYATGNLNRQLSTGQPRPGLQVLDLIYCFANNTWYEI